VSDLQMYFTTYKNPFKSVSSVQSVLSHV